MSLSLKHLKAVINPRVRFHSKKSGRFVSRFYALMHPGNVRQERK